MLDLRYETSQNIGRKESKFECYSLVPGSLVTGFNLKPGSNITHNGGRNARRCRRGHAVLKKLLTTVCNYFLACEQAPSSTIFLLFILVQHKRVPLI